MLFILRRGHTSVVTNNDVMSTGVFMFQICEISEIRCFNGGY